MNPNSNNSESVKNVNDTVISQSVNNEHSNYALERIAYYAISFAEYDDAKLQETVAHERKVRGWGSERSYFLAALKAECEKRNLEYCW